MTETREVSVLFFARLREAVGMSETRVPLTEGAITAAALLDRVCADDPGRREAIGEMRVRVAVNQKQVPLETAVKPGDEVAFFPPVTGG